MIEDKARVRAVADQVGDLAQLVVRRAQIEDELPPSDLPDPLHECVPSAETCRLPLDVLADAFDAMAGGERVELTIDRLRVGEVGERHDAGETRLRSEEHTSELQSLTNLVCRLLLEKKKKRIVLTKQ